LAFCGIQGAQTEAFDGGEDVVCRLGPAKGVGVDGVDIVSDSLFEFPGRAMAPAPALLLGQGGEEALDLVEPRGVGRGDVEMPSPDGGRVHPASARHRLHRVRVVFVSRRVLARSVSRLRHDEKNCWSSQSCIRQFVPSQRSEPTAAMPRG